MAVSFVAKITFYLDDVSMSSAGTSCVIDMCHSVCPSTSAFDTKASRYICITAHSQGILGGLRA
ncbi:MAG: hypothetical protein JXR39_03635 [Marinilabiliaceae bacterium]|nr:hypothetical protein [Marinilabiliaceae bacterium]